MLDMFLRFMQFLIGVFAVLSAGWVVWNARLLYYRLYCIINYRLLKKPRQENPMLKAASNEVETAGMEIWIVGQYTNSIRKLDAGKIDPEETAAWLIKNDPNLILFFVRFDTTLPEWNFNEIAMPRLG